ncbi:hypothetical protein ACOME3_000993 [Neoechinorhynchus agilis]
MSRFGARHIRNTDLNSFHTIENVVDFFETVQLDENPYEKLLHSTDLPSNLNLSEDYIRFGSQESRMDDTKMSKRRLDNDERIYISGPKNKRKLTDLLKAPRSSKKAEEKFDIVGIDELEEMFKDRYTELDIDYRSHCNREVPVTDEIPIVLNWRPSSGVIKHKRFDR